MKLYEYHDEERRGRIERTAYTAAGHDGRGYSKYANIYLPYGYDDDGGRRYNVLYLMHGGGGNADAWLDCCKIKNMLDCCISSGEAEPLIVVFPSFYTDTPPRAGKPDADFERGNVLAFQRELAEELLPVVESRCRTYAEAVTPAALKASRMHRGFGGFSMGAATTWFAFTRNLDYFSEFVPLSGDCWAAAPMGGAVCTEETAEILHQTALRSGYSVHEYSIHAATGTNDPANKTLTPQIEAMKRYPDTFVYDESPDKGNLHFLLAEGATHCYEAVCDDLYHYLPDLFCAARAICR